MTLEGLDRLESERSKKVLVGKIAELLEKSGLDVDDIGRVEKVRFNTYQALTKDADGEAHIHDLEAASVVLSPKWADGPAWPVVQAARPVAIKPPAPRAKRSSKWRTAVILPDPQIGFRRFEDGTLDPFHDESAMKVALRITAALEAEQGVDKLVNLGDFVDFPMFGKYVQEPAFALTTQMTIDRGHLFLGEQRAVAPHAELVVIEGNHDRRLQNAIVQNAANAFGIKVANAPTSWPVLSVPYLLRFDDLGVKYIEGYPAGEYWINDRLVAIHGRKVKSGGSTAAAVVKDETVSQLFGHIHRLELQHRTTRLRRGPMRMLAATPGCLCRVDGAVPSVKGSTDLNGRPVESYEDWQQGVAVVSYKDGDEPFHLELVHIADGTAMFRGQEFTA